VIEVGTGYNENPKEHTNSLWQDGTQGDQADGKKITPKLSHIGYPNPQRATPVQLLSHPAFTYSWHYTISQHEKARRSGSHL
jgi:hypothetical protein